MGKTAFQVTRATVTSRIADLGGGTSRSRLLFFFLGDVRLRLRHIPARRLAETMPEIMKRRQVARLDEYHPVIRGAPDMGILRDNRNILRHFFLELFPARCSFLLVRLGEWSYPEED